MHIVLTALHVEMFLFKHQDILFLVITSSILITCMLLKQWHCKEKSAAHRNWGLTTTPLCPRMKALINLPYIWISGENVQVEWPFKRKLWSKYLSVVEFVILYKVVLRMCLTIQVKATRWYFCVFLQQHGKNTSRIGFIFQWESAPVTSDVIFYCLYSYRL